MTDAKHERAHHFQRLHQTDDLLILPGVWDVTSARAMAAAGFPAIGTTSSGVAWTLGCPSAEQAGIEDYLAVCRRVAADVDVPVTFDLESGFDRSPEAVVRHVQQAIDGGAVGINLEDGLRDGALTAPEETAQKIEAIRRRCDEIDFPLFINARTDVYLGGITDESKQLEEAVARAKCYEAAGASGFFAPGIVKPEEIRRLASALTIPLNVYAVPGLSTAAELAALGVRRVSLGCGPLQFALAQLARMARGIRDDGDWSHMTDTWLEVSDARTLAAGQ